MAVPTLCIQEMKDQPLLLEHQRKRLNMFEGGGFLGATTTGGGGVEHNVDGEAGVLGGDRTNDVRPVDWRRIPSKVMPLSQAATKVGVRADDIVDLVEVLR